MPIDNPRNLFLHELADIYDGERQIEQMLSRLAGEVEHPPLRDAFQEHKRQTREQIKNLERCFDLLGGEPDDVVCHVVRGLTHEHEMVSNQNPPPELLTLYDMGAASKTEHFEIASYQDLVASAKTMGESEVADLLQQNLRQEQEMENKLQKLRKDFEKNMTRES